MGIVLTYGKILDYKKQTTVRRRGDGMHRLRKICIALMLAAILVLGVGCGGPSKSEPAVEEPAVQEEQSEVQEEEPEVQEDAEQTGQPADDDLVYETYNAYRSVLLENEYDIRDYFWQLDGNNHLVDEYTFDGNGNMIRSEKNNNQCIAFADINDDGTDELLFMSAENESVANLHIYRYDADLHEAVEIEYDCETQTKSEQGYLRDVAVAGGSKYMVFKGKDPGTLYMAYIITDETAFSDMTEFTCTTDGEMIRNWHAMNRYSYYDKSDEYFLNDEKVSGEKGGSYFVKARKNYGDLIMFSGYTDIMSVFEHVKSDSPAAMCFDDAIDWLDSKIED